MNVSYSFVSFIDALGIVQGLLFGIMLILLHSKKNKATLFLGLFIILFSIEPIPNILNDLGILAKHPQLELFPVAFHFLAYPLLYIYIQKISIFGENRPNYWTLIPGIMEFVAATIVFFLPYQTKLEIKTSEFAVLYFFVGFCYTLYISYLILRQIHRHHKEIENQYASIHSRTLNWMKWFIYLSIIFHLTVLSYFFIDNHIWYIIINVIDVVLIYWVSFKGITQENINALVWVEKESQSLEDITRTIERRKIDISKQTLHITPQLSSSLMSNEEAQETFKTVENYIKSSRCFINDKLTIIDVAEATDIHPKRISYTINSIKSLNFNNYINCFRVELAKELLKREDTKNLSIEGIGLEAGFHSKTTFYSAFKKFETMTPAQYKSS